MSTCIYEPQTVALQPLPLSNLLFTQLEAEGVASGRALFGAGLAVTPLQCPGQHAWPR